MSDGEPVLRPIEAQAAYEIFWWKTLPLGARLSTPQERPPGLRWRGAALSELLAAQIEARSGAKSVIATTDGEAPPRLSLPGVPGLKFSPNILDELAEPAQAQAENVSVVICTRDRPDDLLACLASLQLQNVAPDEIIVVDNSKAGSARLTCEAYPNVLYVHDQVPGLSHARNVGVRAAHSEIIVFTDDDVEMHPNWLAEIAGAFARHDVDAVAGLVLPASLKEPAQACFQFEIGFFEARFLPLLFDRTFLADAERRAPPVWRIGAGANMAFRRSAFARAGVFDTRLGAGASGCSEDSEFWHRLLLCDGACLYEPRAVVFHHHRADWGGLRRQIRAYMRGHVAALVIQSDTSHRRGHLRRIWRELPVYFIRTGMASLRHRKGARLAILCEELIGYALGLTYLLRLGWRRQRTKNSADAGGGRSDVTGA